MINENDYKPEVLELLYQPWTIEIRPYSDGGFFARVVELRGCMTEADTQLEALQQLEEAHAEWLAAALEAGDAIPKPSGDNEFSGKIFVRTSPHLHRMVSEAALREGVSMSQWVSEVLARAVAFQDVPRALSGAPKGVPGQAVAAFYEAVEAAVADLLGSPEGEKPQRSKRRG